MDLETDLTALLDRQRIAALQTCFAQALDGGTLAQFLSVFTDDVTYSNGPRVLQGHAGLRGFFEARQAAGRVSRHMMSGLDISFDGPDAARSHSVWLSFAGDGPLPVGHAEPFLVADMHDDYLRTPAGWRIARRVITPAFRNPGIGNPPSGARA
ncbi:nuclear transport factor 2 family protein [Pararhodobacter zhoushanensis]|uniref:Nuclear transport factor 2 family protein n=1 Tax=Pararhodobacter zhoushanensis TaxID=2479545 RepID=A0ABT3GXN5_9RHOB|nr:nuclear transport factor 2 family protein [Pararhodobacter zhoushanensis]MCW1932292.1 nuclear transport factor 2 family protein [Pararhodobacter zhoushanensis]